MYDSDEAPETPTVDPATFDRIRAALASEGPTAAIDKLIAELRAAEDFQNLFYALLLKKRVELGVSPFPTGPSSELPTETHEPYEQAIRAAGRRIGNALLERPEVSASVDTLLPHARRTQAGAGGTRTPGNRPGRRRLPHHRNRVAGEDCSQEGLRPGAGSPRRCSAITMVSSSDINNNPDLRDYCVGRLIHALHSQLGERLQGDLAGRGVEVPADATVSQMVESHPEIMADDAYHIDIRTCPASCRRA
ncbi:MAG: hypothetical protein U0792_10910 [Gemmataceae bacterium]